MTRTFRVRAALLLAAGLMIGTASSSKAQLTFGLDYAFSGSPPGGSPPWLTATFTDIAGGVQLTLSAPNLAAGEFVDAWYFNLAPTFDPASLVFTRQTGVGNVTVDEINLGADSYKADGDGFFDIVIDFAQAGSGRFNAGESVVYTITGITGLSAASFNYQSVQGGGNGMWTTAAHIQGLAGGKSVWASDGDNGPGPVPEPTTMLILASFVALAVYLKRRQLQFAVA